MKKKMLSLMLTGVLFAGMIMPVCAAETTLEGTEFTTEGSVSYVDTTVYRVTLPTANCFNFIVDPQGILSVMDPDTYSGDKYPGGTVGCIVPAEETGAYINNKSSVPIKLMVKAYLESDDSTGAPSTINLLNEAQTWMINAGIDNNMWLTFDITNDELDVTSFANETSIKTETVNQYVVMIDQNGKPTEGTIDDKAVISFALNGASYKFDGTSGNYTYAIMDDETGDSVGIRLSGFVNKNADWSAYAGADAEKIIVKTVFDFDRLSTDYKSAALDGRAHGVLADTDAYYFDGMAYDEDGNPTGGTADGAIEYVEGWGSIEFAFDFGTGTKEIKVTSISINGADIDSASYKIMNGMISIKSTDVTVQAVINKEATPEGVVVPIIVNTSDGQATTVNVTMYK